VIWPQIQPIPKIVTSVLLLTSYVTFKLQTKFYMFCLVIKLSPEDGPFRFKNFWNLYQKRKQLKKKESTVRYHQQRAFCHANE